MDTDLTEPVAVTRIINAPASAIFTILVDPTKHPLFDGSDMLREGAANDVVTSVGDIFVMKIHNEEFGDYEMNNHVVDYEVDKRIGWAPTRAVGHPEGASALPIDAPAEIVWSFVLRTDGPDATVVTEMYDCTHAPEDLGRILKYGTRWVESMTKSLERLDELCTGVTD